MNKNNNDVMCNWVTCGLNTFQNLGGYSKVNKNRLSVLNP